MPSLDTPSPGLDSASTPAIRREFNASIAHELECNVRSNLPEDVKISYTWKRNFEVLANETARTLMVSLNNDAIGLSETFRCAATLTREINGDLPGEEMLLFSIYALCHLVKCMIYTVLLCFSNIVLPAISSLGGVVKGKFRIHFISMHLFIRHR